MSYFMIQKKKIKLRIRKEYSLNLFNLFIWNHLN